MTASPPQRFEAPTTPLDRATDHLLTTILRRPTS